MANCEAVCINEHRIRELEKDIQANKDTHQKFFDRFENLGERMVGYEKDMTYITSTITDISRDVKEIKETPGKRWDAVVMCVITSVVGLVVGFLLSGVIPG